MATVPPTPVAEHLFDPPPSEAELLVQRLSTRIGNLTAQLELFAIRLERVDKELARLRSGADLEPEPDRPTTP